MQVSVCNEGTFPFQAILVVTAMVLAYLAFAKPSVKTDTWMKAFLALAFAWSGVVFFLIFTKNPISTFFGAPRGCSASPLAGMLSIDPLSAFAKIRPLYRQEGKRRREGDNNRAILYQLIQSIRT